MLTYLGTVQEDDLVSRLPTRVHAKTDSMISVMHEVCGVRRGDGCLGEAKEMFWRKELANCEH